MTAPDTPRPGRHWPKILLLVALAAVVAWLFGSGAWRAVRPEALRDVLRGWGVWGPLAFVALFTFVQPLGLPGHVFIIGAALLWEAPAAFALALVGATLAQTAAFYFYRYVAHDWAQARIPERLRRWERALVDRPLRTVLLLRLVTFTWPLAPPLLAASRIRAAPMIAATVVGLVPGTALDIWVGAGVVRWLFGTR